MSRLSILFIALALSLNFSTDVPCQEHVEKAGEESTETGPRNLKGTSYFEIGANLGFPALLNGAVGYWLGPVGLRLSGMYWGDDTQEGRNGIQCDIGYKLSDNANTRHSLAVAGGISREPCCDWSYLGAVYSLDYKWFFLEIGLGKIVEIRREVGPLGSSHAIVQVGYMHRFIPKPKRSL